MNKHADRGKLFLPFASLTGFEEMVAARCAVPEQRRCRTDEENEALSQTMRTLRRGMGVRVTYAAAGGCQTCCGTVRQADLAARLLVLRGKTVPFDDIYALEPVDLPD